MAPSAAVLRRLPAALDARAWCLLAPRRWKASGKNRYNMIRQRATEQHVDYFRQLEGPRPYRPVELDPRLHTPSAEVRQVFSHPELTAQPPEEARLASVRDSLAPKFSGQLGQVDMEPFGSLEVVHDDIFAAKASAVVLPMAPNLMPYRGLSLEAFDRGGKDLVTETFETAQKQCTDDKNNMTGLTAGDTIAVEGRGVAADNIIFVIMPWFWQGSPMDAGKRFRHCVKQALLKASSAGRFESVVLPHIGGGIFGYEPRASSSVLLEEAMEALLQLEAEAPNYTLRRITLMDHRLETAEALNGALTEVAHRWLPDRQLTTSPQYWGQQTRRLVVLPDQPNFFWKRHRVKFKKYHGVKRKWRRNYIGNIRPNLWRAHKVHQPPPLLVYKESGEAAPTKLQRKARPFFFRGVTHWLFPHQRSGFHGLRKSGHGHWVGRLRQYRLREDVRPRL